MEVAIIYYSKGIESLAQKWKQDIFGAKEHVRLLMLFENNKIICYFYKYVFSSTP